MDYPSHEWEHYHHFDFEGENQLETNENHSEGQKKMLNCNNVWANLANDIYHACSSKNIQFDLFVQKHLKNWWCPNFHTDQVDARVNEGLDFVNHFETSDLYSE